MADHPAGPLARYRVGPGRQEIRLHWLPPIPVNVEDLN